ncbi:hypothetical protein VKT23_007423 [Stygiomarasmius scandens]|uniref:Uncharacterized protein n=1 Tax=Marasmiellus scandens TaxID=2682957 RepID=A0ABR1JKF9_9AGAR
MSTGTFRFKTVYLRNTRTIQVNATALGCNVHVEGVGHLIGPLSSSCGDLWCCQRIPGVVYFCTLDPFSASYRSLSRSLHSWFKEYIWKNRTVFLILETMSFIPPSLPSSDLDGRKR